MKALRNFRGVFYPVKVSELVCLIEHQHLETVFRDTVQVESCRVVGSDNNPLLFKISLKQFASCDELCRKIEFRDEFGLPLRA